MKHLLTLLFLSIAGLTQAQIDADLLQHLSKNSTGERLNMDAVYDRPFLNLGKLPVSVGGYMEANWQHIGTEGVSEGHQFQMRRMTLFVSSTIAKKLKFMSEIEFEEGGNEIAIEFASLDVEFHPLLNLRGGIIMNPIGAFNQNHDGPKWEFTDRPVSATQMLPATWSTAGFDLFGKTYKDNWMLGYELYLTSGFDHTIIDNDQNRTFLPASKANPERFGESANGTPLISGKMAVRYNRIGELGLSYMGGSYNTFEEDGEAVDQERKLHVFAMDYNHTLPKWKTFITGEWAWINIDIPNTYTQFYGNRQQGGFVDIVQPILSKKMLGWENATLNLACRLEYVDWNVDTFKETGYKIGDELWSIMPAISFRPSQQTVFRLNYRLQQQTDVHNNPPEKTGGFSLGIATYF
ncbi:MAG TPA: hypothetical protein VLZ54_01715 [Arenibacter sp.]|nr:hypothetical protein [Arenibacter sp.]